MGEGPFEILLHAEIHYFDGEDTDRRISLISFDNAIEVAISTYLTLSPTHRNGIEYPKESVVRWQKNYHTKLDFFFEEISNHGMNEKVTQNEILYYHDIRNKMYHEGGLGVPDSRDINEIRKAAIWVVSSLFEIESIEQNLIDAINSIQKMKLKEERDPQKDELIDDYYGSIEIAGIDYNISDILFSVDKIAYNDIYEMTAQMEDVLEKE